MSMRRLLGFGAVFLSLVLFAGAASGASQAELDELRREINRLSEQIEAAQSARTQAAEDVLAAKARLDAVTAELREAEGVLASINAEIAAGEEELAAVTRMLDHFGVHARHHPPQSRTRNALSRHVIEMSHEASTARPVLGFRGQSTIGPPTWTGPGLGTQPKRAADARRRAERQQDILDQQRVNILAEFPAAGYRRPRPVESPAQYAAEAEAAEALVASPTPR